MSQETGVSFEVKIDQKSAENCALSEIREVYKNCGVEEACVLDTSESDADERDSLFVNMKDELRNIGFRKPTCETDGGG